MARRKTYPDKAKLPLPLSQVPEAVFKIHTAFQIAGGRMPHWKLLKLLGMHPSTLDKYLLWMTNQGLITTTDETAEYQLTYADPVEWIDVSPLEGVMATP